MKDSQRIDQMKEGAAFLRNLPDTLTADDRARLANIALGMERFADFVLDRDAAPNREHVAEIRQLRNDLAMANKIAKEIDDDFAAYRDKAKATLHENSALKDRIAGLEKAKGG